MADSVIIVGIRRGGAVVPSSEIQQMVGRAGRKHSEGATVTVVVDDQDEGRVGEMFREGSTVVKSAMGDADYLSSAIISEICTGEITDVGSAELWGIRSFCENPPIRKALKILEAVEAIRVEGSEIYPTDIGRCAAKYYFHPADVYGWYRNFTELFDLGYEDHDVAPAWALGNVPFDRVIGDLQERRELATECKYELPYELSIVEGSVINVVAWWYLIGGPPIGALRPACLERRKGIGRIIAALRWLDMQYAKWGKREYFGTLELRVAKGLKSMLVPLCKDGFTKGQALYLYEELSIRKPQDLCDIHGKMDIEIDDEFKTKIEAIARRYGEESN